jgi:hypothetical protein
MQIIDQASQKASQESKADMNHLAEKLDGMDSKIVIEVAKYAIEKLGGQHALLFDEEVSIF